MLVSDISDDELDELVTEDEEDQKPTSRGTLLAGQLQEPRYKTLNLKQLHDLIHLGSVDLNPVYQRDVVWPESKMIGLIQSFFMNFYVPPIIFAVQNESDGDEIRVCIDGKQRCTSVLRFMDGQIPFKSSRGDKYWYTKFDSSQRGGLQLPVQLKRKFDNISIQLVEYDHLNETQQRDIFQRVQLGVPLSMAEKLQAIQGPWREWISELQKKYVTNEGTLGHTLKYFDLGRGRPFQNINTFVMMAYEPGKRSVRSSLQQQKFLARSDPPEKTFVRKVEMTLSLFVEIATSHHATAFGDEKNRVAPVEFWFISFLIFTRMGNMSLERLAREIPKMRASVRACIQQIRGNDKNLKMFHKYIDTVPRIKQPGEKVAAEEFEDEHSMREQRYLKRRREEEDRDPSYHVVVPPPDGPLITDSLRSKQQETS